ncbi:MAG: LytTR family DNA-binding domain-containing protein [Defluviitaleaceae bacterium]|nr:LytTR family DNA-binding domain-containing protein [Defluviitaleaceae bacterium]MCL2263031.1 LytTR family DNA-binding domain-containing protein [Defluviitaleaceae bacterium]
MLPIFIYEDDSAFLQKVRICVENYVSIENFAMPTVCATSSPDDVLNHLKNNDVVTGLYFLNLGHDLGGIRLAEKIRIYDPWGSIIFIASNVDLYKFTFEYKIEAMDYILKTDTLIDSRICKCIRKANAKFTNKNTEVLDRFIFKINRNASNFMGMVELSKNSTIALDYRKIMYFETSPELKNNVIIHTSYGRMQFRGSLSRIEQQLDKEQFFRCKRSIIVNLDNVVAIDFDELTILFENNILLADISPDMIKNVNNRVEKFRGKSNL